MNVASTLTYLVTILSVVGIDKQYSLWKAGDFANFAAVLGGAPFKYVMIASAVVSNFACANSSMLPCAMQLYELGGEKYLDFKFLRYMHPKYGMPWVSLFGNAIMCAVFIVVPFTLLVQVTNVFYSIIIILICLSAVVLRFNRIGKSLNRPFYAVKSIAGLMVLAFFPITVSIFVLGTSVAKSSIPLILAGGFFIFFLLLYAVLKWYKKRKSNSNFILVN